mmetsp:Transcript_95062/g.307713  ORF Transcript_95062/g.307713 Transcript_95062/m.307713 type:complete len:756 (+) Transcript_95062:152-2419(+)
MTDVYPRQDSANALWNRARTLVKVQRAVSMFKESPQRRVQESFLRRERALSRAGETDTDLFRRTANTAVCAHLLEEGHEGVLDKVDDVNLRFAEAGVGQDLGSPDLLLTSLQHSLDCESDAQIKYISALPTQLTDDLHYAPFALQKLMSNRTYMGAIADALDRMLDVQTGVTRDEEEESALSYPLMVKPCRKPDHTRFIVFNDRGLAIAREKVDGKSVVANFIEGSALYHVHVIDLNIFVVARPCLPRICADMSSEDLQQAANKLCGRFVDSEEEGRYLTFDSDELTEITAKKSTRGEAEASALAEVKELAPMAGRITQVASILEEALGVGMFGFDILLDRATKDSFHLVDMVLMPVSDFKNNDEMVTLTALHLFRECQQRAVRVDIRRAVGDAKLVVDLMRAQHPGWGNVDPDKVTIGVLSASTKGDKTGLVVSLTTPGKDTLVCRLRGVVERTAFEQAIANEMMDTPNTPLTGKYFGSRVLIGYTEALVTGCVLEKVIETVDRRALCLNIGAALRKLHTRRVDVQSPDYLGVPLCVSRSRTYSIIAWEAITHVDALKTCFDEVFPAMSNYDVTRLPAEARADVFGHFDCNLTNILVDVEAAGGPSISFIDWEQAGPNIAAYDFGKFLVSVCIAVELQDAELQAAVADLVQGYAPEWDRAATERMKRSLIAMMPYVAAVNFMSNVRHASTEVGDRWVSRGRAHYRIWSKYQTHWALATQDPTPAPSSSKTCFGGVGACALRSRGADDEGSCTIS